MNNRVGVAERGHKIVFVPEGPHLIRLLPESLQHQRDLTERSVIQRALVSNGYCRSRAATALGISRVTLYKKMKKYGLMNGFHGL